MGVTAWSEMVRVKHRWRGGQTERRCEDEDRTGGTEMWGGEKVTEERMILY